MFGVYDDLKSYINCLMKNENIYVWERKVNQNLSCFTHVLLNMLELIKMSEILVFCK